jgi:GTPase Era involved in 16S rRNA processing
MQETKIDSRLNKLKEQLKEENDILHEVVDRFRELDKIAYKLGFLSENQSYADRLSWWPMISVLGLYSAGKSTFINHYLGQKIQDTATQAVDDKFTVICFSGDEVVKTLPGIALDADPRFPFYQISKDIAEITSSNSQRIDAYLRLKTCLSEQLRGKILIDSPGFDADDQRDSTLHITKHIIDLSDLVLVFFDARHPEPRAMRDTLKHLVKETIDRPDSNKFLYILNQMDITAREDNPEDVVAAWQRSLAQAGLTAGRFYRIYNPDVCMPIENQQIRERIESKCQSDLADIHKRMEQVRSERAYRVISMLEHTAKGIEEKMVPQLQDLIQRWKNSTYWTEAVLVVFLLVAVAASLGFGATAEFRSEIGSQLTNLDLMGFGIVGGVFVFVFIFLQITSAKIAASRILKKLQSEIDDEYTREGLMRAFRKNTSFSRALFIWTASQPVGWGKRMQRRIGEILGSVNRYVQELNDRFTNPSGKSGESASAEDTN